MQAFLRIFFSLILVLTIADISKAEFEEDERVPIILDNAENFFIALKENNFGPLWELLSEESREKIVESVYDASANQDIKIEREKIIEDFEKNGLISYNYWNSYLNNFDPDIVLEKSRWEIGFIEEDEAEILITFRKSDRPARLKMFRENGRWKIGLAETFWTRKY